MRRKSPDGQFDLWLGMGHDLLTRTEDEMELRRVEAWAEIISLKARVARLSRIEPAEVPEELGPALSAKECAYESGWRQGQTIRRGFSPRFFYDHASDLPFAIRHGRSLRFTRAGFLRWLAARGGTVVLAIISTCC